MSHFVSMLIALLIGQGAAPNAARAGAQSDAPQAAAPQAAAPQTAAVDVMALPRMVQTERAFAAAAKEIGVRDAFLTFFADDAVKVSGGKTGNAVTLVRAKDGLTAAPLQKLPLAAELLWEPFTGHISSDGTMGWLTGGYASLTTGTREIAGKGAYFSVWRRQADKTWKVWLDEGISLPDVWRDAAPFRVAPQPDAGAIGTANESLDAAEARVSAGADGWRQSLAEGVRLHRNGAMPVVGRDAAIAWANGAWSRVHYSVVKTLIAGADDLAVAIGGYDATAAAAAEVGTWIRVWKRDVTGRWRIVFETSTRTSA